MKKAKKRISTARRSIHSLRKMSVNNGPPATFVNEMVNLLNAGELELFERKAKKAIQSWPNHPIGWKALGNLFLMRGRHKNALEPLSKCLQIAPDDAQVHNNLGSAFLELGRFKEADESFRQALELNPDYVQAHTNRGTCLLELGRFEEAIESYRQTLALKPDFSLAHNNLGNAYKAKGDFTRAKDCYMRALALNPNLPQASLNLGLVLDQYFDEKNEAKKYYQKELSLDPNNAEAHQGYGNFLVKYGSTQGLKHLEMARQLKPNLKNLQSQLGTAYLEFGKKNEAISSLKIALKENPDDVDAKYYMSIAEGRLPDRKTRTAYIKNLFDNYSSNFETHLVEKLEYKVPIIAREMIEEIFVNDARFQDMADLGCGTGLSGLAFTDCAKNIVGIDLSRKMLDIASDKGVYDILLQGEITEVLDKLDRKFDFFLATEVTIYFQELKSLFASIKTRAVPGALFVFSTERCEGDGFAVNEKTGRTAHCADYIRNMAENFNFQIIKNKRLPLRKDKDGWAEGELYIMKIQK